MRPEQFELPGDIEGGWILGNFEYPDNPRKLVSRRLMRLVNRWLEMRRMGGGLGQSPMLPHAGGYFDQPAAIMDAFRLFDQWAREVQAENNGAEN